MAKSRDRYYRALFLASAVYDCVLGLIFTFFYKNAFDVLKVHSEPGGAYIPLIGTFFFVLGIGYFLIARNDLRRNVDLILVGALYKLAYASVAFLFWARGEVPSVLLAALFGSLDILFFALMIECFLHVRTQASSLERG